MTLKDLWKSHFNIGDSVFLIVVAWKEVSVRLHAGIELGGHRGLMLWLQGTLKAFNS